MDSRRLWIAILLLALLGLVISTVNSQPQEGYAVMLRGIEASELGVDHLQPKFFSINNLLLASSFLKES